MMIEIYTGGVGSGKSYCALSKAIDWTECWSKKRRRYVIANFPIKGSNEYFIYVPNEQLNPIKLVEYSVKYNFRRKESSALLIIDEASVMFNSRDWNIRGSERLEWIKFFAQSRKLGYDILLITQDLRSIDRQIRNIADIEVKHLNLTRVPYFKYIFFLLRFFKIVPIMQVYYTQRTSFRGIPVLKFVLPWKANRYDTLRLFNFDYVAIMQELTQQGGKGDPPAASKAG